jgi:hypothetical protein
MHAMLGASARLNWFPVIDAPANLAANGAQRSIALDVLECVLRVASYLDGAEFKVHPGASNATA